MLVLAPLPVDAQSITIQKTGYNEDQLHTQLLATFPQWGAVTQPDGRKIDPGLLRVESTATQIKITFPDSTDPATVQAVINAFVLQPLPIDPDIALGQAITAVDTTTIVDPAAKSAMNALKNALLGKVKNGKAKATWP